MQSGGDYMPHTRQNKKVITLDSITVTKENKLVYHVKDIFRDD